MSKFLGQLKLRMWSPEEVSDAGYDTSVYDLLEGFSYLSDKFGLIEVPSGFVTDFASIPRAAWAIIDPEDPRIAFPSVIHDFLYSTRGKLPFSTVTRENADYVLREAMEACGAGSFIRNAVYQAVRVGGNSHWSD